MKLALLAATAIVAGSAQTDGTILFWTDSPIPSLRMMRANGTHVRRIAAKQNAKRPTFARSQMGRVRRDAERQAAAERLRRPDRAH
jgi:hypothetical protein